MWFATNAGLDRFDGYEFKTFKHIRGREDSLACVSVRKVISDNAGGIWAACDETLERFDPLTETFTHFGFASAVTGHQSLIITSMEQNPDGTFWVTSHSGLFHFDPRSTVIVRYGNTPGDPSTLNSNLADFIVRDSPHTIWVVAAKELNHFDEKTLRVTEHIVFSEPHTIVAIHADRQGTVWVARSHEDCAIATLDLAGRHLNCLQPTDTHGQNVMHSGNGAMVETSDGAMWFGTQLDGLFRYDLTTHRFTQYLNQIQDPTSLAGNDISSLFRDSSGNMWTALQTGGIDQFSPRPPALQSLTREHGDLHSNLVTAVSEDQSGILWIASYGGLNRIDRKLHSNLLPKGPGVLGELSTIVEDPKGRLLGGTFREGIRVIDPNTGAYGPWLTDESHDQTSIHPITRLVWDRDGQLWASARSGLELIDQATGASTVFTPDGAYVEFTDLKIDQDGLFWLSSNSGLFSFDPKTRTFRAYKHSERDETSLSNNETNFVHIDDRGSVWVATQDGLSELDRKTERFHNYRSEDGLAGDVIGCMLQDERRRLWIATDRGLSRLDLASGLIQSIPVDGNSAGPDLTGRSACFRNSDGEMIFGGYSGAVVFKPENIPDTPPSPHVALTDFEIAGRSIQPGPNSPLRQSITYIRDLVLGHDQNAFEFAFAALNARSAAGVRYRYRLQGIDKDWTIVRSSERVAAYTAIPPGRYKFEVQAATSAVDWNGAIAEVSVRVLPPWWATWWFRTAYVSFAVLSAWVFYRRKLHSVYREATLRASERVEERTRVARELHDTLMQTVEGCRILAETATSASPDSANQRNVVAQLADWLRRASDEGRVAMQTLRPPTGLRKDLIADISDFAEEMRVSGFNHIEIKSPNSKRTFCPGVQDEVYRIACEALRNACRYAQASHITVTLDEETDLLLVIADDGVGIPRAVLENGRAGHFGLQGMRERASKLGGRLDVDSTASGTTIALSIPENSAFVRRGGFRSFVERWGLQSLGNA